MKKKIELEDLADIIAEGFGEMGKRFDNLETRMEAVETRLEAVEEEVHETNERINKVIVPRLDNHGRRIKDLELRPA